MDVNWFKSQQKKVGVTAEDIARKMGRTRSNVSHIYSGKQQMSLDWARAFSEVLQVSLDEVLARAGALEAPAARRLVPGFSESDAVIFEGKPSEDHATQAIADAFGGNRPGVDVWTVKSGSMALAGYLPGDFLLVDSHQSETCRAGDVVIAQNYDNQTGTAKTVLRRFQPPVLLAASADQDDWNALIVDGSNVAIRGRVIASWRQNSR